MKTVATLLLSLALFLGNLSLPLSLGAHSECETAHLDTFILREDVQEAIERGDFLVKNPMTTQLIHTIEPQIHLSCLKIADIVSEARPEYSQIINRIYPFAIKLAVRSTLFASLKGLTELYRIVELPYLDKNHSQQSEQSHYTQFTDMIAPDIEALSDTAQAELLYNSIANILSQEVNASPEDIKKLCILIHEEICAKCSNSFETAFTDSEEELNLEDPASAKKSSSRTEIYTLIGKIFNLSESERDSIESSIEELFTHQYECNHEDVEYSKEVSCFC